MEFISFSLQAGERALEQIVAIALIALPLLLVTLIRSSGKFGLVLRATIAPSMRVNVGSIVVDVILMTLPIWWIWQTLAGALQHQHSLATGDAQWPNWAVIGLVVFAHDGVSYFRHRFEHSRWLWPSHAFHHSDETMNCLTILRFHPINRLTTVTIDLGALLLMGFPEWSIAGGLVVRHYYGIFVHANVPWTLGPLGYILVSPAMHRWHHVREGKGVGANYYSVFSLFDRAFGTLYCPGPCTVPLGVAGIEHTKLLPQLIDPFLKLVRRSKSGSASAKISADTWSGSL